MTALGLDCGGTESRWHLLDRQGQLVAHGRGPRLSGHLFEPRERERAMDALRTLCRDIRKAEAPVEAVTAGVTGLSMDSPERQMLIEVIFALLDVPMNMVSVDGDVWLAYRAVFQPGEGILVYAGTGSAACHVAVDYRRRLRAGGHGWLVDDSGSGFWIGQQALRWMMREHDRTGELPDTALSDAMLGRIGGRDWVAIRSYVYADSRRHVAELAPAVAAAAEAGDQVARQIFADAGRELARLGLAMIDRVGLKPVALTGGVARAHPLLFETFDHTLAVPECRIVDTDLAEAAARLALESLDRLEV